MKTSGFTAAGAAAVAYFGATSAAVAQCYVDGASGNDSSDGATEATPVQSQAAIPSGCTEVRYKRGSVFYEPVAVSGSGSGFGGGTQRTKFTNYGDPSLPLPQFITDSAVVNSYQGGIVIDGLHMEGSDAAADAMTAGGGSMGVCVQLGGGSQLLNSEITDCGIGIMLFGDGSLVQGNVVYDLDKMVQDDADNTVYANSVGGAEGIFINGSNNEVAYNQFINCKTQAAWQSDEQSGQVGYDGGATEVSVGQDGVVTGLKIHHNFSYNNCGFFEVSGFGDFIDSEFYYNVSVDSAWAMLLQVNETTLSNIRWENNTFVHHADAYSPSIAMIYRAELTPDTVFFNNNLVIFDGASSYMGALDAAISATNNLFLSTGSSGAIPGGSSLFTTGDPGVVNLGGTSPQDFDLVQGSPAIDAGLTVAGHTLDFLNRTAPDSSGVTDIGAFEYNSAVGAELPEVAEVPPMTPSSTGGAAGDGTTEEPAAEAASGGTTGTSGSPDTETPPHATPAAGTSGSPDTETPPHATPAAGTSSSPAAQGTDAPPSTDSGDPTVSSDADTNAGPPDTVDSADDTSETGNENTASGGSTADTSGAETTTTDPRDGQAQDDPGCSCGVVAKPRPAAAWVILGLALGAARLRLRRRR